MSLEGLRNALGECWVRVEFSPRYYLQRTDGACTLVQQMGAPPGWRHTWCLFKGAITAGRTNHPVLCADGKVRQEDYTVEGRRRFCIDSLGEAKRLSWIYFPGDGDES